MSKKEYTYQEVFDAIEEGNLTIVNEVFGTYKNLEDSGFLQSINNGLFDVPLIMIPFTNLFRSDKDVTENSIKMLEYFINFGMDINISRGDNANLLIILAYGIGQIRRKANDDTRPKIARYLINNGIDTIKKNIYGADFISVLNYDESVSKEYSNIIQELKELANSNITKNKPTKKEANTLQKKQIDKPKEDIIENKFNEQILEKVLKINIEDYFTAKSFMEQLDKNTISQLHNRFSQNAELLQSKNGKSLKYYSTKTRDDVILIPSYITKINKEAFKGNESVKIIIFEEGTETIEFRAFENCINLHTILLPESLKKINGAFNNNPNITRIYVPSQIKYGKLFINALDSLEWCEVSPENKDYYSLDGNIWNKKNNTLVWILNVDDNGVFYLPDGSKDFYCQSSAIARKKLSKIVLPKSVANIVPKWITDLEVEEYEVSDENPNYISIDGVIFNKEKTTLVLYPPNKSTESYTIPNFVNEILDGAFSGFKHLKVLQIPKSVEVIGDYFYSSHEFYEYDENVDKTLGFEIQFEHKLSDIKWSEEIFEFYNCKYECSMN